VDSGVYLATTISSSPLKPHRYTFSTFCVAAATAAAAAADDDEEVAILAVEADDDDGVLELVLNAEAIEVRSGVENVLRVEVEVEVEAVAEEVEDDVVRRGRGDAGGARFSGKYRR
jgi:hypothetical protein